MKFIYTFTLTAAMLGSASAQASVPMGCFNSISGLTFNSTSDYNSVGYCSTACKNAGKAAFGTNYKSCYCGDTFPASTAKTDNSSCSTSCPGFPSDGCGGTGTYNIYTSGLTTNVDFADGVSTATKKPTSTASPTSTAKPSVVTVGGQTVVVTASSSSSGTASPEGTPKSSSPSKAGIAAGVVVGIVAIMAIGGGAFLFIRNRRRRAVEEEYRRNAAVNDFIAGGAGKPPHSSGGSSSFTDTRLDPVMAQRRMSDGSIADNHDYSRKILKVTNA